ncbi:MAG: bis(5'-nucleosyl)-tetraphosphatase (symmetrical) YqeK [Clostridiales bacterium]|nr:bis(5'-nucleosyl)-tetraphosphatase (symmetrical) YqeK [Clostridiales bacterium]
MKIGLFGGSFDPIHNGHLSIIEGALNSGCVDIVVVIPTVRNPFKRGRILSAAPYRFYMTKRAVEGRFKKNVFLCDIEFFLEGISYTANTIANFCDKKYLKPFLKNNGFGKKAEEDHSFYWLCGSDILPSFDKWYKPEKILENAGLLVAQRPGDPTDIESEKERIRTALGIDTDIRSFEIKGVEAASSSIRADKDFDRLPEEALDFIRTHGLYPSEDPLSKVSDKAAETYLESAVAMYPVLGEKRLLHTLNTGLLSAVYAGRFGADPDKALIAGTLHDCAKEIDIKEQKKMAMERCPELAVDEKLYHSPAGAVFAGELMGIDDEEILNAITFHTTGKADMTTLEKIVFLADKLEPSRTYTDLTLMRKLAETDLDASLMLCVRAVKNKFDAKGREIHPYTFEFMKDLGII